MNAYIKQQQRKYTYTIYNNIKMRAMGLTGLSRSHGIFTHTIHQTNLINQEDNINYNSLWSSHYHFISSVVGLSCKVTFRVLPLSKWSKISHNSGTLGFASNAFCILQQNDPRLCKSHVR